MHKRFMKSLLFLLPIFLITLTFVVSCSGNNPRTNSSSEIIPQEAAKLVGQSKQKLDSGDLQGAIKDASDALTVYPNLGDAYLFRGIAYAQRGEREQAIRDLETAQGIYTNKNRQDRYDLVAKILTEVRSPIPTPTPIQISCSTNISGILARLQNPPIDPFAANQMVVPLEEAKHVLTQVASQPGCVAQRQSLCQPVQFYWDRYILLRFRRNETLDSGPRNICRAGCLNFSSRSSDISACQDRCEEDYQRSIQSSGQQESSEKQSKESFLRSVGCL